jgi:hypothetical protein
MALIIGLFGISALERALIREMDAAASVSRARSRRRAGAAH